MKCKYYVSQKQNAFNNQFYSSSILLTFIYTLMTRLLCTKLYVLSNLTKTMETGYLTGVWRTDRTCAATRRRTVLIHLSQHLRHWLPARDNQASGPGPETWLSRAGSQSLRCWERWMSPGPEVWLSLAGSQCLRCWERWMSPVRRRVAAHVRSVRHGPVCVLFCFN